MVEMGPQIGWGRFELERFDVNKKVLIVKPPGHRPGLPGNVISFYIVRLDPARSAGPAGHLPVKVYHSPFAEGYGPSSKPVCHMIRGVLGGMASLVFGKVIESQELSCLAHGDECCRFEVM